MDMDGGAAISPQSQSQHQHQHHPIGDPLLASSLDLEAGPPLPFPLINGAPNNNSSSNITTDQPQINNASLKLKRKRWRRLGPLLLNASRRFRFNLGLKKHQGHDQEQSASFIRAHVQVIRAALHFKSAGERAIGNTIAPTTANDEYGIGLPQLVSITRDHDTSALARFGEVKGLAQLLKTNLDTGNTGDADELLNRRNAFGSNTYPLKKGQSFFSFLWEAWQDLTLIILIIAAVASLGLGIKTEGIKEGWYNGGSIAFAVLIIIFLTATCDYRQSLQFQCLNQEKRNIKLEVVRGGRRERISIFDVVVGDVVPLKIGDQIPADGILIAGHSLAIDESSMTGESKIIQKDKRSPFLMAGCKVADGAGTMLVN